MYKFGHHLTKSRQSLVANFSDMVYIVTVWKAA